MAQVVSTLEDIRLSIREEVRPMIEESELRITKAVQGSFDEYEHKYDKLYDSVDNQLQASTIEFKNIRRLVGQHTRHTQEIMELKARAA